MTLPDLRVCPAAPARALLAVLSLSTAATAFGQSATWEHRPWFGNTASRGLVNADLDGTGRELVVVTGATRSWISTSNFTSVLGAVDYVNGTLDLRRIRTLSNPEILRGIRTVRSGNADRIVGIVSRGAEDELVTWAGLSLTEISRVRVPQGIELRQIADIDADGEIEVLGLQKRHTSDWRGILLDYRTGVTEWLGDADTANIDGAQLDTDPALEMVISRWSEPGLIVDGASRSVQWSYPDSFGSQTLFGNFSGGAESLEFATPFALGSHLRKFVSQPAFSPVAEFLVSDLFQVNLRKVIDIDQDGVDEMVVSAAETSAFKAISMETGARRFEFFTTPNYSRGPNDFTIARIGDAQEPKLVFGTTTDPALSFEHVLAIADPRTGVIESAHRQVPGPHLVSVVDDINADGRPEVLISHGATASVLDLETGTRRYSAQFEVMNLQATLMPARRRPEGTLDLFSIWAGRIQLLDGTTLSPRWQYQPPGTHIFNSGKTYRFNEDTIPDLVVSATGGIHVLDGATGAELYRTVPLSAEATSSTQVAVADTNLDGVADFAYGRNQNLYFVDRATNGLVPIPAAPSTILDLRFEGSGADCRLIVGLSDRLERRHCVSGVLLSTRPFGFEVHGIIEFTDSSGTLVLGSGQRLHVLHPSGRVTTSPPLGTEVGVRNNGVVLTSSPQRVEVIVGSEQSVNRLTLDLDRIFWSGAELD